MPKAEEKVTMLSRVHSRVTDQSGQALLLFLVLFALYVVVFAIFLSIGVARPVPSNHDNFIYGLFQGWFAVPTFFVSLFDDNVAIYQISNIGGWYDCAYLLGIGALLGGSSRAS